MARMILALRPRPGAEADLERCLADLQDSRSPEYHRWLSPEQFGARFGPAPADLARVTGWLRAGGFAVEAVAAGRLAITFSGTVAQVEQAFRTPIRRYRVAGRLHQGNAQDPAIPAELAGLVAGVVSLHDLPRRAQNRGFAPPAATGHPLTPGDFAVIYHLRPLYRAGLDGTGTAIAIAGRTRIPLTDVARFRKAFGLPPRAPELILNGPDPGDLGGQEAGEADLDVEWAGAVAPAAAIRFVASASSAATDGVDLSAQYIVDHDLAPILSLSFGRCEPWMGAAELAFYRNLWAQAAAQGITVVVAAGDSGPAGCDPGGGETGSGRAVSGLASTPYNLAVGGTQFQEDGGDGWRPVPDPDGTTARGYLPEQAWNESGSVPGGTGLWATGGGTSAVYPKPGWQRAPGVPANAPQYQYRCLPDVALAAGRDGYRVETSGRALVTGGTSCAAPAFAGILALVVQKTGSRQGSAGAALYRLASAQFRGEGPRGFHDITLGSSCVPGTQGFSCRPGYDLATGLGSVDALALVSAWDAGTGNQVFAGIRSPGTDRTVASGARVRFTATAQSADPAAELTFLWDFGDGGSGQGPVCAHTYLNPGTLPLSNLVVLTVRDATGARGTDTRTLTVLPAPAPGERIVNGGFELGALGWRTRGVGLGDHSPEAPAHQGRSCAWFPDRHGATTLLQQTVWLPAAAASARLSFWLRVDTRDPGGGDPFQIKVRGADGRLAILARIGGPGIATGWQAYSLNLGAYRGQVIQLSFVAAHARGRRTTGFALDDVSLIAQDGEKRAGAMRQIRSN